MVEFYMSLPAEEIAQQVAGLLNNHNKLYKKHTAYSIIRDPGKYFLEIAGDRVIGCSAIMQEDRKITRQYHLCVHPEFRRRGIARKLKQTALNNVRTPYVYVTIREDNVPSLNLNYSFGFVFVKKEWSKDHNVITLGRATIVRG
jgi:ribosomal protein S18 acetylase RimI-like enzyme